MSVEKEKKSGVSGRHSSLVAIVNGEEVFLKDGFAPKESLLWIGHILGEINRQWADISHQFDLLKLRTFIITQTKIAAKKLTTIPSQPAAAGVTDATVLLLQQLDTLLGNVEKITGFSTKDGNTLALAEILSALQEISKYNHIADCQHPLRLSLLKHLLGKCDKTNLLNLATVGQILHACGHLAQHYPAQDGVNLAPILQKFADTAKGSVDLDTIAQGLLGLGQLAEQFLLTTPLPCEEINLLLKSTLAKAKKDTKAVPHSVPKLLRGLGKLLIHRTIKNSHQLECNLLEPLLQAAIQNPQPGVLVSVIADIARIMPYLTKPPTTLSLSCFESALTALSDCLKKSGSAPFECVQSIGDVLLNLGEIVKNHPSFYAQIGSTGLVSKVNALLAVLHQQLTLKMVLDNAFVRSAIYALRGTVLLGISRPTPASSEIAKTVQQYLEKNTTGFPSKELDSLINQFALYLFVTQKNGEPLAPFIQGKLSACKPADPTPKSLQAETVKKLIEKDCTEVVAEKEFGPYPVDIFACTPVTTDNPKGRRIVVELDGIHHMSRQYQAKDAFRTNVLLYKGCVDQVIRISVLGVRMTADTVVSNVLAQKEETKVSPTSVQLYEYIASKRGGTAPPSLPLPQPDLRGKATRDAPPVLPAPLPVVLQPLTLPPSQPVAHAEVKLKTPTVSTASLPSSGVQKEDQSPAHALVRLAKAGDAKAVGKLMQHGLPVNPYNGQKDPYVVAVALMATLVHLQQQTSHQMQSKLQKDVIPLLISCSTAASLSQEYNGLSPLILATKWKSQNSQVYDLIFQKCCLKNKQKTKKGKRSLPQAQNPSALAEKAKTQADKITLFTMDADQLWQARAIAEADKQKAAAEIPSIPKAEEKRALSVSKTSQQSIAVAEAESESAKNPMVETRLTVYEDRADIDRDVLQKSAESGDTHAQFVLAELLCEQNKEKNADVEAMVEYWYTQAADQNHVLAQGKLGYLYYDKKQFKKAVYWYQKAVEQGHADAQYNLAILYLKGCGVDKDSTKKIALYEKAAKQGHVHAQYNLGVCYAQGRGVKQDRQTAADWYQKAAEQGHAYAQCELGSCYAEGRGVGKNMQTAIEWYQKAAEQNNVNAQQNLGIFYAQGRGVEKNMQTAVEWYQKAAGQGHVDAQYTLGLFYAEGHGVEKNMKTAVEWYRKAAAQHYAAAQCELGCHYAEGLGVEKNMKTAVEWYRKAAAQGHDHAQHNLGVCYAEGLGVEQDMQKAAGWFQKAAQQDHADAQYKLGVCYEKGFGVMKNIAESIKLYEKAAKQGSAKAQDQLEVFYIQRLYAGKDEQKAVQRTDFVSVLRNSGSPLCAAPALSATDKLIQRLCQKFDLKNSSAAELQRGLRKAAANNQPAALKHFLQLGVNVNARDAEKGKTALHHAAQKGHTACVEILLAAHAERLIEDNNQKTPADCTDNEQVKVLLAGLACHV